MHSGRPDCPLPFLIKAEMRMSYYLPANTHTAGTKQRLPYVLAGCYVAALASIPLLTGLLARGALAQDRTAANQREAPELVAPTSGETISDPAELRFRWRPGPGLSTDANGQYRRLYQRLVVQSKANSQGTEKTPRPPRPHVVKTFPGPNHADQPQATPPTSGPYPTVGDWFPDLEDRTPPPNDDNIWEARLLQPIAGEWFPDADPRLPLPAGNYVWEVHLLGETPEGDMEMLASSHALTFTIRAPQNEERATASSPAEESSSTQDISTQTPDNVTLTLMPKGGLFLSGVSSFDDLSGEAGSAVDGAQSVFTWGGSVAFGSRDGPANLRLTGLHTTGSLVSTTEGIESRSGAPETMLALTGDLVLRPFSRLLIQPYAIGGAGARRLTVSRIRELGTDPRWEMTTQVGAGIDLRMGDVTLGLEIVDYLTGLTGSENVQHDAFLFLTVGIPVL